MNKLDHLLYGSLEMTDEPGTALNELTVQGCLREIAKKNDNTGKTHGIETFGGKGFMSSRLKAAAIMLSIILITGVSGYAIARKTGLITLKTGDKEMDVDELEPLDIDIERFKSLEGTEIIEKASSDNNLNYYSEITNIFNSTEELEALAGIKLWSSDSISVMHNDFSDGSARGIYITLYEITPGSGQGIMNCDLLYNDVEVYMHGHFVFGENRDLDSIGFGTEKDYYRTFKYGDGKTAYFVKKIESDMNGENETRQHVYFTACKMQFQMSVPLSAEGTKVAEEMISIISGE